MDGRQINVDATAGGRGNSENRKKKIVAVNKRIHEERVTFFISLLVSYVFLGKIF
jgi:hypothetical protein